MSSRDYLGEFEHIIVLANGLRFLLVLLSHEPIMPEPWAVSEYIYDTGIYL